MTQHGEPPTLDQVLNMVERLPLADQARLVEQVLPRLTHALTAEQDAVETGKQDASDSAAFAELIQLGQSLARDWPAGVRSAAVLSAMRDER
ncbi:MAG TPA: hypothetical protein VF909_06880 [Roseiflexaceae bacterium]